MTAPFGRTSPTPTSTIVPTIAPAPTADSSSPSPSGPTPSTSLAKIVMSALLCPKIDRAASVARMSRSTGLFIAYWMPPQADFRSDVRAPIAALNLVRMSSSAKMIAK